MAKLGIHAEILRKCRWLLIESVIRVERTIRKRKSTELAILGTYVGRRKRRFTGLVAEMRKWIDMVELDG